MMDESEASIKIQSSWRSKRVRRFIRKEGIHAIVIQRMFRGYFARRNFQKLIKKWREIERLELERLQRRKAIQSKERELYILKNLPASDVGIYETTRRNNSAKLVQRAWRGVLLRRHSTFRDVVNNVLIKQAIGEI